MNRMVWVPVALSLVTLSGCSSTASTPQVRELHQEVSQLNQQMQHLTSQASALEIQGQLNSQSQQGAWLLPQQLFDSMMMSKRILRDVLQEDYLEWHIF